MADGDVRRVQPADVDEIVALVAELAAYERASECATATAGQFHDALFGPNPAVFGHVVEHAGPGHRIGGFALWFLNFSTWLGVHGIYLEDLYVRASLRGSGYGSALLQALAAECVANDYGRLEWWVLDWNTPGRDFYAARGAEALTQWVPYRLTGQALLDVAATGPTSTAAAAASEVGAP